MHNWFCIKRMYHLIVLMIIFEGWICAQPAVVSIQVDATQRGKPLRHVWQYYGYDECNYTTTPNCKALMRTVAQIVSYELPVVLSILGVVMLAGSLSMNQIVIAQKIPFIVMQPLGFLIFFIGALAEMNRCPFDLLEADSEIVAGYHTEYSGMKFAMFYLGEYGHTVAYSAIISTLFLGGWQGPLLPPVLWLIIKMLIVFFVIVWIRSTLPRFRVDQLMAFAWKGLFPMAIINLFIVAAEVLWLPTSIHWVMILINFAFAGILILLWSRLFTLGGGRVEV